MGKKKSIFLSMVVVFTSLFALVIILIASALYGSFSQTVRNFVNDTLVLSANAQAQRMRATLEQVDGSITILNNNNAIHMNMSSSPFIARMILDYDGSGDASRILSLRSEYTTASKLLSDQFEQCFPGHYSAIIYIDKSYPIGSFLTKWDLNEQSSGFRNSEEVEKQAWYGKAVENHGEPYWFTVEGYEQRLWLAKALYHVSYTEMSTIREDFLGVLILGFDVNSIDINIKEQSFPTTSVILDEEGRYVYSDNQVVDEDELSRLMKEQEVDSDSYLRISNQLPMGLRIVNLVSLKALSRMIQTNLRIIAVIGVLALALAIILILVLSRSISRPIVKLSYHMKTKGDELVDVRSAHTEEVKTLYEEFNSLTQRLKTSKENTIRAIRKKDEAELHALQAQMNPHFIYNTLNSVSCLAMLDGKEEIAQVLGDLSAIMRYSIKDADALVPLTVEMDILEKYRNILKCCYKESVDISFEVEDSCLCNRIPKLLIQPLIENAVLHGGDLETGLVKVDLRIFKENRKLMIQVEDSGQNANIDEINLLIASNQEETQRSSIGLKNISQRLAMVYEEGSSIYFDKTPKKNTRANITIPLLKEGINDKC